MERSAPTAITSVRVTKKVERNQSAMCQRITCRTCGKPSFAGCGRHVEAVLGDVPRAARCVCRTAPGTSDSGGEVRPSALDRLFAFVTGTGEGKRR